MHGASGYSALSASKAFADEARRDARYAAPITASQRSSRRIAENTPMDRWLRWAHDFADRTDPLDNYVNTLIKG